MINSKEARELAFNNDIQERTTFSDIVIKFMNEIHSVIKKEAENGKLYCKVSCIDNYTIRTSNVFGYYYNNRIISEVKKRLINLGFNVTIERNKDKDQPDYTFKFLVISWD